MKQKYLIKYSGGFQIEVFGYEKQAKRIASLRRGHGDSIELLVAAYVFGDAESLQWNSVASKSNFGGRWVTR